MSLFDRLSLLALVSPSVRAQNAMARRWSAAAARDPELVKDVIRLSGLLNHGPLDMQDGVPVPAGTDPGAMGIERGRHDFARMLLALMSVTPHTLNELLEDNEHD